MFLPLLRKVGWLPAAIVSLLVLLAASPALAHGRIIIQPRPGPGPRMVSDIRLTSMRVDARVDGGVAQVTVDQIFVNGGDVQAEGTYLFPMPPGSTVSSFTMTVDGQAYQGELMNADQARRIYEGIVGAEPRSCSAAVRGPRPASGAGVSDSSG